MCSSEFFSIAPLWGLQNFQNVWSKKNLGKIGSLHCEDQQGRLHIPRAGGGRPLLRALQYISMCLHRGRVWSSNSLLEGKCLVYWSQSYLVSSWASGGFPQKNFHRMPTNAPSQDRRDVRISVFRAILAPPAPPWKRAKGHLPLLPPTIGVPEDQTIL